MNWYLLYTKRHQENAVSDSLTAQGFSTFNPKAQVVKQRWGKRATITEPLFPSYVFVELNFSDANWYHAKNTKGVKDFIKFDGKPSVVSRPVVDELIARHKQGFIKVTSPKHRLKAGDKVRVTSGPMKDLEGIFEAKNGEERSIVLLRLLTENTRVQLDSLWIERA